MLVDLVMWTLNGSSTLPYCLQSIERAVPSKVVNRKIAIDAHSSDETREWLKFFGWSVIEAKRVGVSSQANQALGLVETEFFCSFEQDIVLNKDWWSKIAPLFNSRRVVAASGVRFSTAPKAIRDLQAFAHRKYLLEKRLNPHLSDRELSAFASGKTLDNTLYRTKAIRDVGGFPILKHGSGVDTVLAFMLEHYGFRWKVNPFCVSEHLRKGVKEELAHQKWYARGASELRELVNNQGYDLGNKLGSNYTFRKIAKRFVFSPFEAAFLVCKTGNPSLALLHPLIKLLWVIGYIEGKGLKF